MATPSPSDWSITPSFSPYLSLAAAQQGLLVRAEYIVEVEAMDSFGASDTRDIRLVIAANASNIPVIRSATCVGGAMPTQGGTVCNFTGTGLGAVGGAVQAWLTRTDAGGQAHRVDFSGCAIVEDSTEIECISPEGYGTDFDVHVFAQNQEAFLAQQLQLRYAPPAVDTVSTSA